VRRSICGALVLVAILTGVADSRRWQDTPSRALMIPRRSLVGPAHSFKTAGRHLRRLSPRTNPGGRRLEPTAAHRSRILEQFTRQAVPFSEMPAHSSSQSLALVVERAGLDGTQSVLDVGCGPGVLALALARRAREVTGIDLVPAMIARAQALQAEQSVANVRWFQHDVERLPFADGAFDVVVTRFTFHHLLAPRTVLDEMVRVCRPGGTVAVIDVATSPEANAGYNEMEKLRDPSHVRALTFDELIAVVDHPQLGPRTIDRYGLEMELEAQLRASFPNPGDDDRIRALFEADVERQALELRIRREARGLVFAYPVTQLTATRL
jgi:SAM-dependent methyltransferase